MGWLGASNGDESTSIGASGVLVNSEACAVVGGGDDGGEGQGDNWGNSFCTWATLNNTCDN